MAGRELRARLEVVDTRWEEEDSTERSAQAGAGEVWSRRQERAGAG